jgi:hypothetical protein
VAAAEAGAAMAADGVDLVHEHDAGRRLLRLLEQVAHARRADTDEHLDEVGAGDGEERDARLARDRTCEQRLAGARRPVQQHTLRDARAERLELLRVLEEFLDLLELLDGLLDAGNVLEADLRRVRRHPLRTRLAERHHLRATALDLVHQEDPEAEQQDERQQRGEDRPPRRRAGALGVVEDLVVVHLLLQIRHDLVARVMDRRFLPVVVLQVQLLLVRVEDDLLDRAARVLRRVALEDLVVDLRVGVLLALRAVPAEGLQRQPDERRDDHEREERATEESIHLSSFGRVPASV